MPLLDKERPPYSSKVSVIVLDCEGDLELSQLQKLA